MFAGIDTSWYNHRLLYWHTTLKIYNRILSIKTDELSSQLNQSGSSNMQFGKRSPYNTSLNSWLNTEHVIKCSLTKRFEFSMIMHLNPLFTRYTCSNDSLTNRYGTNYHSFEGNRSIISGPTTQPYSTTDWAFRVFLDNNFVAYSYQTIERTNLRPLQRVVVSTNSYRYLIVNAYYIAWQSSIQEDNSWWIDTRCLIVEVSMKQACWQDITIQISTDLLNVLIKWFIWYMYNDRSDRSNDRRDDAWCDDVWNKWYRYRSIRDFTINSTNSLCFIHRSSHFVIWVLSRK